MLAKASKLVTVVRAVNTDPNEANQLGKIVSKNITAVMNPSAGMTLNEYYK